MDDLIAHLQELDPSQKTVLYCQVGLRGYLPPRNLLQYGFTNVFNPTGLYVNFPALHKGTVEE